VSGPPSCDHYPNAPYYTGPLCIHTVATVSSEYLPCCTSSRCASRRCALTRCRAARRRVYTALVALTSDEVETVLVAACDKLLDR
jgi:hypothetical protein